MSLSSAGAEEQGGSRLRLGEGGGGRRLQEGKQTLCSKRKRQRGRDGARGVGAPPSRLAQDAGALRELKASWPVPWAWCPSA